MKTLRIPPEVERHLIHDCPRLAELLRDTDGRLELERFNWLCVLHDADENYAMGYKAGRSDRDVEP